jgi:hypothetical protein
MAAWSQGSGLPVERIKSGEGPFARVILPLVAVGQARDALAGRHPAQIASPPLRELERRPLYVDVAQDLHPPLRPSTSRPAVPSYRESALADNPCESKGKP